MLHDDVAYSVHFTALSTKEKQIRFVSFMTVLCNAFGVSLVCCLMTQGGSLDKLGATLGFGVQPRCGWSSCGLRWWRSL